MQFMINVLMYGQIITAWGIFIAGVLFIISTMLFENDKKRAWFGYSGLFMLSLSVFMMIHYFVKSGNSVSNIIRTLYETFPEIARRYFD